MTLLGDELAFLLLGLGVGFTIGVALTAVVLWPRRCAICRTVRRDPT